MNIKEKILKAKEEKVKGLILSGFNIKILPESICMLTDLQVLYLDNNHIERMPDGIINLINLRELYLGSNELNRIPIQIYKLINLERLYLDNNNIIEIDEEIKNLSCLVEIDLDKNQLTDLPNNIKYLKHLKSIFLRNNKIKELSKNVVFLPSIEGIYLDGNPIEKPPIGIINEGIKSLRRYYEISYSSGFSKLYEAKLIIVGQGKVGKTSIKNKLLDPNYVLKDEGSTKGIEISKLTIKPNPIDQNTDFILNIWDFGGQEIYYSTHQFFLTESSLYLFVWDAREGNKESIFKYWLNIIKYLSNNSPVVVVQNKIEERSEELNRSDLIREFPNIIGFVNTSVKANEGFNDLKKLILDNISK
ncbi:MAG: GTP-binding protein, partial [bacterium]|nr:GTP-binding protein [bacterium]